MENKIINTPTPEEVLYEHGNKHPDSWNGFAYYHDSVLFSMESYKRSHTAPLHARIEELEKENERLTKLAEKRKRQLEAACADSKYFNDECDRLSEALEGIANFCSVHLPTPECKMIYERAKEALKGGEND